MGSRFYRRIKLLPGLTLNISKSGVSLSVGTRGARATVSRHGVRKTVGIPGTGMSYTNYQKHGDRSGAATVESAKPSAAPDASNKPNFYVDKVFGVFFKKGVSSWIPKLATLLLLWFVFFIPLATADQPTSVMWGMAAFGMALNVLMLVLGLIAPRVVLQPSRGAVAEVFLFYVIALIVGPILIFIVIDVLKGIIHG